jgi:hypothetical protein
MTQSGIFRLAFLLILCSFAVVMIYVASEKEQNSYFIAAGWALITIFIHTKRKDIIFLNINMLLFPCICFVEYSLISIPLIICLSLNEQWISVLLILLSAAGISFIDIKRKRGKRTLNTRLQQYIPSDMYEWKAGIRKYFFPIIIAWMIGFFTVLFVASVPTVIFIIGLILIEFYETNESWQILISHEAKAIRLLYNKILHHLIVFVIIVFPLVIAFVIFHPDIWFLPVIELIIFLSIHIYCIVLKYAFYIPNTYSGRSKVFLMVGIPIGLIPVTTPMLWIFSIYFFQKARINLNFYLNDYN